MTEYTVRWANASKLQRRPVGVVVLTLVAFWMLGAVVAFSQVQSLYYKEFSRDGKIFVFNSPERVATFEKSGEAGTVITLPSRGPNGETLVAENETAIDLFLFRHNLPSYERPTAKAAQAGPPTTLKVLDGELKLSSLLQVWYILDDSPVGTSTTFLGNVVGNNTFRLRRAEVRLSGTLTPSWGFEVMFDPAKSQTFTPSGVAVTDDKILQDLAISYLGLKGHQLSIGQKKVAMTEEGLRSPAEIDFAERARVTRVFGDRRESGLFYKGDLGKGFAAWASVTNGTPSNVVDNSNDTVFCAGRLDYKPSKTVAFGVYGGKSGGETSAHLTRRLAGAHFRYDGPDSMPVGLHLEYLAAADGQVGKSDLRQAGYYATALYTMNKTYQLAVRYDELDRNRDVKGNKVKTLTAGLNYLVKGKNVNFKLDYFRVTEEGRKVGGHLAEDYNQGIVAVQLSF